MQYLVYQTSAWGMILEDKAQGKLLVLQDLVKEAAPHYKKAKKYFDGIAKQLVSQGHALDIFACSLDQVGLSEMKVPVEATGGLVVQTDTFDNPVFKESMKRAFARHDDPNNLGLASNATFEVCPFCLANLLAFVSLRASAGAMASAFRRTAQP